jgi:hypothetical protein
MNWKVTAMFHCNEFEVCDFEILPARDYTPQWKQHTKSRRSFQGVKTRQWVQAFTLSNILDED